MGFFKDLISDIKNAKKPIGQYQSKIIDFVNHLMLISYDQLSITKELAFQKAEVYLKEIDELAENFENKEEKLKVYHPQGDIATNVLEAQLASHELLRILRSKETKILHSTLLIAFGEARNKRS